MYQESRCCCCEKLNETDDDGGVAAIECRSSRFEDADSVENHGVDAGELLEEHDTHRNSKRFQNRSLQ